MLHCWFSQSFRRFLSGSLAYSVCFPKLFYLFLCLTDLLPGMYLPFPISRFCLWSAQTPGPSVSVHSSVLKWCPVILLRFRLFSWQDLCFLNLRLFCLQFESSVGAAFCQSSVCHFAAGFYFSKTAICKYLHLQQVLISNFHQPFSCSLWLGCRVFLQTKMLGNRA